MTSVSAHIRAEYPLILVRAFPTIFTALAAFKFLRVSSVHLTDNPVSADSSVAVAPTLLRNALKTSRCEGRTEDGVVRRIIRLWLALRGHRSCTAILLDDVYT